MNASMPNSSVAEVGTAAPAHHKSTTVISKRAIFSSLFFFLGITSSLKLALEPQ
jgi:hypothetical protein